MTETKADVTIETLAQLPDLACRRVGGGVLAASDEFFAERENLIKQESPTYRPHTFTNKGQEYDGWETRRRRRDPGDADWVIVRLGIPGVPRIIVVDTSYFKGNFPPFVSLEGCGVEGYPDVEDLVSVDWQTIVDRVPLRGDSKNLFTVDSAFRCTHVRLRIYPDGGVARLRVHGEPIPDPRWCFDIPLDLAGLNSGGCVVRCSDWFFSPPNNMLQPGESLFMADGWETARRRDDGHDWAVVRLAAAATPSVLEIDTTHYKGNAPDRVSVTGIDEHNSGLDDESAWVPILAETRLQPDTAHRFRVAVDRPVTHLRLDSFPDGGIARLRIYGKLTENSARGIATRWFDSIPDDQARQILITNCGLDEPTATRLVTGRGVGVDLPKQINTLLGLSGS